MKLTDELAKGKRAMDVSKKLAKKYSVSIQQAREYVRLAKTVLNRIYISKRSCLYLFKGYELFRQTRSIRCKKR